MESTSNSNSMSQDYDSSNPVQAPNRLPPEPSVSENSHQNTHLDFYGNSYQELSISEKLDGKQSNLPLRGSYIHIRPENSTKTTKSDWRRYVPPEIRGKDPLGVYINPSSPSLSHNSNIDQRSHSLPNPMELRYSRPQEVTNSGSTFVNDDSISISESISIKALRVGLGGIVMMSGGMLASAGSLCIAEWCDR